MLLVLKVEQLLLQIVNGAIKVVGALVQHAHALVATGLVVQNYYDHVAVNIFAFVGVVFEDLLGSLEAVEGVLGFLVLEAFNAGLVYLVEQVLKFIDGFHGAIIVIIEVIFFLFLLTFFLLAIFRWGSFCDFFDTYSYV